MTAEMSQLRNELLELPPAKRAFLAQELWVSLDDAIADSEEEILIEAERRNAEMSNGKVQGVPHEEVMQRLRNLR
jgi:putative addiction module component (TIGR02574 family)